MKVIAYQDVAFKAMKPQFANQELEQATVDWLWKTTISLKRNWVALLYLELADTEPIKDFISSKDVSIPAITSIQVQFIL